MKFLIIIFTLLNLVQLKASAQEPDMITYNGKEYFLLSNPLELYFSKNPEKTPQGGINLSSLWRGYRASFEVINDNLYVKNIEIPVEGAEKNLEWKSVINDVFPTLSERNLLWYSGILTLPFGEAANIVNMGYGSTYENYILLQIDKGKTVEAKQFTLKEYEKFKLSQFEKYKMTREYKIELEKLLLRKYTASFSNDYLKMWIFEYLSKFLKD